MLRRALLGIVLLAALGGLVLLRRPAERRSSVVLTAREIPKVALSSRIEHRLGESKPLPPDTRFLDAFGEVAHALGHGPATRATAAWHGGTWTLRSGDREIARVSEYPSCAPL